MNYINLYIKSNYSLLSSLVNIDNLIEKAKQQNHTALALTDKAVMYGAYYFYKQCKANNIKPIIGLDIDLYIDDINTNIVLLAKNENGYRNLIAISSHIQNGLEVTLDSLNQYNKDLICISPSLIPYYEIYVMNDNEDYIKNYLLNLKKIYQDLYLGFQILNTEVEKNINNILYRLCNELNIQKVYLNEVLYLEQNESQYLEYIYAIRDGKKINDPNRTLNLSNENYFKSFSEVDEIVKDKQLIINSNIISDMCNLELNNSANLLPKYPLEHNISNEVYLRELCRKGLLKRYEHEVNDSLVNRLNYELDIIIKMGFVDYFLIVWDFIKYAKNHNILVGPGRGSAAGSLVAYCLGITNVDPIQYGLLFERFLNPERISLPDIDTDFPDSDRDRVIQYVANKYGNDHVAQIITFGTMGAKQAIRDVGRVMDIPLEEVDKIAKSIPNVLNISLKEAYHSSPNLQRLLNDSKQLLTLYKIASIVEGMPRHTSTHAAGIVMSSLPLTKVLPVQKGMDYLNTTQYSMEYLEELGLIKMDFLGLRNLTILDNVLKMIKSKLNIDINISKIPLDDEKTLALFQNGYTTGVFQFESDGMRNVLKKLHPTNLEDIIATNALFRPGPMDNIESFINRKYGREKIDYIHPDLKDILEPTYGIIVYQEQIMNIALKMANYTLGEADILRRAVSKKIKEVLDNERKNFVSKSVKKGYSDAIANNVYDLIVKFANYGFNRAHSVAYSILGYQMAYLKANYPTYFLAALLTSVVGSESKTYEYINECKMLKIPILPPSINDSERYFKVSNNAIRFSLSSIKNVGEAAVTTIINERDKGYFKDFRDFVLRCYCQAVNKRVIESLIDAYAFNEFEFNNATMHKNLDGIIASIDMFGTNQDDLLVPKALINKIEEFSMDELIIREKKALGLNLLYHPVSSYKEQLGESILRYRTISEYNHFIGEKISSVVYVISVRQTKTKKGDTMAFLNVSDETGEMDMVVFPTIFQKIQDLPKNKVIIATGKIDKRLQTLQMVIDDIKVL